MPLINPKYKTQLNRNVTVVNFSRVRLLFCGKNLGFIRGIYDFYQTSRKLNVNVTIVNFPRVKCYIVEKKFKNCYNSPFAIVNAYHIEYSFLNYEIITQTTTYIELIN